MNGEDQDSHELDSEEVRDQLNNAEWGPARDYPSQEQDAVSEASDDTPVTPKKSSTKPIKLRFAPRMGSIGSLTPATPSPKPAPSTTEATPDSGPSTEGRPRRSKATYTKTALGENPESLDDVLGPLSPSVSKKRKGPSGTNSKTKKPKTA